MKPVEEDRFAGDLVHRPSKSGVHSGNITLSENDEAITTTMNETDAEAGIEGQEGALSLDHEAEKPKKPSMRLLAQKEVESRGNGSSASPKQRRYYNSAQWTADGTSIIATSSDHTVSSFILPADLLQRTDAPRKLHPQASIKLPEPTQALAVAPYFSLVDPASQLFLTGCRDHPLHLYHAFPQQQDTEAVADANTTSTSRPLYTYKLIRKESEQYITPSSLLWGLPGTHFICGSANRLDLFDLSRHGSSDGPLLTIPTIPSRRHISKGSGVGMRGTVAALAASPSADLGAGEGGILAAGTWTRWMGMYDLHHTDKVVANWSIAGADEVAFRISLGGQGVIQTLWSPCGRYLVVNERHATGLLVYDIRGTGQLLSILNGRTSSTQQRLHCDVFQGDSGFEVWAGTEDGSVAVWEGVGNENDALMPSWTFQAGEGSPVGSAALHSSGSVVATCSGGWGHGNLDEGARQFEGFGGRTEDEVHGSRVYEESSLRVWAVGGGDTEA